MTTPITNVVNSMMKNAVSPPRDTPVAGRPLVNLSFAMNYSLGGLNPRGYRLTNLAIHLLVGKTAVAKGVVLERKLAG